MKPIYAAAISHSGPKLVAPLRLTNDGDEAATVNFYDSFAAGTKLKIRTTADAEWQQWDFSTITLQPGEFVEICGENSERATMLGGFRLTGSIAASGSIMSMVYGEETNEQNQKILTFNAFSKYSENEGDYIGMFGGCSGLTAAPELPATTLVESCYRNMFGGCSGLTAAPELPATTLVESCYYGIFSGCSKLNEVTVEFNTWYDAHDATGDWLNGVAAVGTFKCPAGLDTTTRDASHVPEGWTVENV